MLISSAGKFDINLLLKYENCKQSVKCSFYASLFHFSSFFPCHAFLFPLCFSSQKSLILVNGIYSVQALWQYYNSKTLRSRNGAAIAFAATARILDGRQATYTGQAPVVASYSSRGPDVNNALLQTADVLKPNIMAPGSSIWAAWSRNSEGDHYIKGITIPNVVQLIH